MKKALLMIVALMMASPAIRAQAPDGALAFDKGWTLQGDRTRIVRDGTRDVLQVETGFAHRRDIVLQDGTIEFDVRLTARRSIVYVHFRVQDAGEREEFYLRPHKSALPDAVQYAPVWQGSSAWQLHHGPAGTASVTLASDRWTRVRVVVQRRRAALFVDDMTTPALLVPQLSRDTRAGSVSLGGFLPADVPGDGPIATFANVKVRPNDVPFDFDAAIAKVPAPPALPESVVVVREWAVSPAFVPKSGEELVPSVPAASVFQVIPAEENGLVQLHRHVKVIPGSRTVAAFASIQVSAPRAGPVAFDLGFSDIATVFVNGSSVYHGDASYSFDRPRREGLIGFDQARLYLPLTAGRNDVTILISDSFGGWGLMGRFVGAPGLVILSR
jgi:hypothetical protein